MDNKTDAILNQMAANFGSKIGQLEGEKAILQVELQESKQIIQELENQLKSREEEKQCH